MESSQLREQLHTSRWHVTFSIIDAYEGTVITMLLHAGTLFSASWDDPVKQASRISMKHV